jgi:gliding motility-associated-like protein
MSITHSPSVLWRGNLRAVMLGMLLSLLLGRGYAQAVTITFKINTDTTASCGNANGIITVNTSSIVGGTPPYQYSLNGGAYQTSPTFNNVAGGNYTVTVEDATTPTPITGSEPGMMGDIAGPQLLQLQPISATCLNDDGQVDAIVTGGTLPYQYLANSGSYGPNPLITGLPSGNVSVTVEDANGCTITGSTFVGINNTLFLDMGSDPTICQGTTTKLTITSTNATSFAWTPAASLNNASIAEPIASPATTTTYAVIVTLGICISSSTEIVTVLPAPIAVATPPEVTICYGQSTQLQGSGGVSYQWWPGLYLSSITAPDPEVQQPRKSTTYTLNVTGANGCTSIQPDTVQVNVTPPAVVFAGDDTTVLIGQTLPLDAVDVNNIGFTSYQWSPAVGLDNPGIQDPIATITGDITYQVTATTAQGCEGTDSITIKAVTMSDIIVPNAFTPNGDGRNDVLKPHAIGIRDFKYFAVFNRWGQRVFYSTNEGAGWDGTLGGQAQPMGTYVWMVMGLDFGGREVDRRGTVVLVR